MQKPQFRLMLDSGAHSLYTNIIKGGQRFNNVRDFSYADTKEFWDYVDRYAEFVKANAHLFSVYVSVDVIFSPERSWEVQQYLENTHKLKPMPVLHYGEDLKWLKKYMDNYEYIGIGGIGQGISKQRWCEHGDAVFKMLSDRRGRPVRKTHGFAITSIDLLWRYPFYTVDSSSWVQYSQYGMVLVPPLLAGEFNYRKKPEEVCVSTRSATRGQKGHFDGLPPEIQQKFLAYFEQRGMRLGKSEDAIVPADYVLQEDEKFYAEVSRAKKSAHKKLCEEKSRHGQESLKGFACLRQTNDGQRRLERRVERGLCNDHERRDMINMQYFLELQDALPEWPWPFSVARASNMQGLTHGDEECRFEAERSIIYMGGNFDLLVYREKEERMKRFVQGQGRDYNRIISFFFHDKNQNILDMKREELADV